jgi:uncharacterized protein YggE
MGYYGTETIDVHTQGSAETDWLSATYSASVVCSGKTGPEAKTKLAPITEKILEAVRSKADAAGIDLGRLQTTLNVSIRNNRQTGEFEGYNATYTIKFNGKSVAAAPEVHDALTSIESVMADTPKYNLNETNEAHGQAFKEAYDKAKLKFETQCKATGLDSTEWGLKSWDIQDEEHRGKTLGYNTDGNAPKAIGLKPGRALIEEARVGLRVRVITNSYGLE